MSHIECLHLGLNTDFFLRADNADERLTDLGIDIGTVDEARKLTWLKKKQTLESSVKTLKSLHASPQVLAKAGFKINHDGKKRSAYEILGYKEADWELVSNIWPDLNKLNLNERLKKQIKTNSFMSAIQVDIWLR